MIHEIAIDSDWRGRALADREIARVTLEWLPNEVRISVDAPYSGDPLPPAPPRSFDGLWEYEVVEVFLVDEASLEEAPRYIEIEMSPHGHHLLLSFEGIRARTGQHEPIGYRAEVDGERWFGEMTVARALMPWARLRMNAYRLCGEGEQRRHLVATALPGPTPDFHLIRSFEVTVDPPDEQTVD